jgi:hypothetical protein
MLLMIDWYINTLNSILFVTHLVMYEDEEIHFWMKNVILNILTFHSMQISVYIDWL